MATQDNIKSLLGKEVQCTTNHWGNYKRVVAGLDFNKGITLVDIEHPEMRTCVTPYYFGDNYEQAYLDTIDMIITGIFDVDKINALALPEHRINQFIASNTPICPYE